MHNLTPDALKSIYGALSQPLPREAIQKTEKSYTKKGYDTSGYGYQYAINRFNDVLGIGSDGWGYYWEVLDNKNGTYKSGLPFSEITVALSIWVLDVNNTRCCVGSHVSSSYGDALKGAITNAFKKTAAFWGVGRHAYEGSLDDDSTYEDEIGSGKQSELQQQKAEPEQEQLPTEQAEPEKKKLGRPPKEQTQKADESRQLLAYPELFNKMETATNVFELNNRCKKYRTDYEKLNSGQKASIKAERDRRKLYLETGQLGEYKDFKIVSQKKV